MKMLHTKGKMVRKRDGTMHEVRRARIVPLWWDTGTVEDLEAWVEFREKLGECGPQSFFLVGVDSRNSGNQMRANRLADRWKTAIRCLGPVRRQQVSIHAGRHTFASLALQAGRSLMEVKEALGHASVNSTNVYLHTIERDKVPDVFAPR